MSKADAGTVTVPSWVLNELLQMAKARARELGSDVNVDVVHAPSALPHELVAVGAAIVALAGKDLTRPAVPA